MTKEETLKRQRMIRLAIPAVVAAIAIVAVAVGTKVWQGMGANRAEAMELRGYWLGMRLAPTNSRSAAELGVPPTVKGVLVADVQPSSRALSAGLAPGDVVTRVDGKEVDSLMDLHTLTTKLDVARQFQVDILRVGRPMAVILQADSAGSPPAGAGWYAGGAGVTPAAAAAAGPNAQWGNATQWPSGR
jgi:S1-C subfamily serine protease